MPILAALTFTANAAEAEPSVPLSVSGVSTFRMGENLVRVILHNMELKPQVEVELIEVPGMERLLDRAVINKLTLGKEVLVFSESSGVFVEEVQEVDGALQVIFDYYYPRGGSALIQCRIPIQKAAIGRPDCVTSS